MKLSISISITFATVIIAAPATIAGNDATLASYNSPKGMKSYHSTETETHFRPHFTKPKSKSYHPNFAHPQRFKTPLQKIKQPQRDQTKPQSRPKPKPEQQSHHQRHKVIPPKSEYAGPQKRKVYDTTQMLHRRKHRHKKSEYRDRYY